MDLKRSGVFHKRTTREEDESGVTSKDSKREGGAKDIKCELFNEDNSGVYNNINEDIDDNEIMR